MMGFGMMHKQGDIVLIPVPFSDWSNRKQRPVLIISNDGYNQMTDDVLVVAITSHLKDLDYSVIIEQEDLGEGALKVRSAIRSDKVYTLSKAIIRKRFGKVNSEVLKNVRIKIEHLIK